ncbi:hypothetical protein DFQ28_006815 [Apophysomyces sp. BC1034]|nr:hypothetical protein DFQ30_006633 [Apophysomyces sp. BC1015]KAG0176836.1 hypothetical protein DFQ29_005581 [Apophysomyces sp. BC1021]KAG0187150.1 hypothetical protein DFQ28_006815 [Apophysomyces sp. BC1034]
MDSTASGTVLGFTNPVTDNETGLFSFNPLVYLYFMLSFLIVPYPIYWHVAHRFNWETNHKTFARHWSDLMLGLAYGTILFVFGNYSKSYSWITVIVFYPALFGYALIAELPYAKQSLPNIKNWPKVELASDYVAYYVCALLIPLAMFIAAIALIKEVNHNWVRTRLHALRSKKPKDVETGNSEEKQNEEQQQLEQQNEASGSEGPYNPYTSKISLHLHHWQIFYMLCFFTRFTHPVSQVAAGIVMACYMEGVCAYGYDALVNDA